MNIVVVIIWDAPIIWLEIANISMFSKIHLEQQG